MHSSEARVAGTHEASELLRHNVATACSLQVLRGQGTPQHVAARRGGVPGFEVTARRVSNGGPVPDQASRHAATGPLAVRAHLLYTRAQATSRKTASVPKDTRSASVTKSVRRAMIAVQAAMHTHWVLCAGEW